MLFKQLPKFRDERDTLTKHVTKKFPKRSLDDITHITIHHSLTKTGTAKAFSNYHVQTLNWPGVGYTFVIEKNGDIVWCNDLENKSYHVGNSNKFCLGVCLVGDFRVQEPTEEQIKSLFLLTYSLQKDLKIPTEKIMGHSEMPGYSWKACPVIDMVDLRKKIDGFNNKEDETPTTIITVNPPTIEMHTMYTVKWGDTLWGIAEDYAHSTVRELLLLNPGVNPRKIRNGQVLRIK